MNFAASPFRNVMSVGNSAMLMPTAIMLPPSAEVAAWDGGFIEHNDRPRLTESVRDIKAFQDLINAWIKAAAQAG